MQMTPDIKRDRLSYTLAKEYLLRFRDEGVTPALVEMNLKPKAERPADLITTSPAGS